jgi:CBS domain containing-hemolysin-like protein
MIERVFDFEHTDVADIFTPRTEMEMLPVNLPLPDAIKQALAAGYSRVPIYESTRDNIVGIFYLRDALNYWHAEKPPALRELLHKPLYVPETKNISELLAQLRKAHMQIAIVLDEYGGTAGLVTIEDVVEEIVGNIQDEYDEAEDENEVRETSPGKIVANGGAHVADVNAALKEDVIPEDEDYETIGGFVLFILGYIPKSGEEVTHTRLKIKVLAADERKIKKVEICLQDTQA